MILEYYAEVPVWALVAFLVPWVGLCLALIASLIREMRR